MASADDFVYENAPLVEVIAEVHWKLIELSSFPGSAIDPHFDSLRENFSIGAKTIGLQSEEKLVPDGLPKELLAHKITHRYRREPKSWPLLQIGPGIFAANIVPPYDGWHSFTPFLRSGLDQLFDSYPEPARFMKVSRLELRYLDAFTEAHGLEQQGKFIRESLRVGTSIPEGILAFASDGRDPILQISKTQILLSSPAHSIGSIAIDAGRAENKPAVVVTFLVRREDNECPQDLDAISQWFNDAHGVLHSWFDLLIPAEIKSKFGDQRKIGA